MKKEPFISVVICTQNRAESLDVLALSSISKLNYPNYEVVVVDDDSMDSTQQVIRKYKKIIKRLIIIRNKQKKGLCFARNLGIKGCAGEIIAFTDDDCAVDKNWLREFSKIHSNKRVVGVGGKSYIGNTDRLFNTHKLIYGCNMSFRRSIFNKFLFDENNISCTHDETDLIYRIRKSGYLVRYSNKAIVNHFVKPSIACSDNPHPHRADSAHPRETLDSIYIHAKQVKLIEYYFYLLLGLILGKRIGKTKEYGQIIVHIDSIRGLFSPKYLKFWSMFPIFFFELFFFIPIKVQIKLREEAKMLASEI